MVAMRVEQTILKNLIQSEQYTRKVIPFLKPEYFADSSEQLVYTEIKSYFEKYIKSPTLEALLINLDNNTSHSEGIIDGCKEMLGSMPVEDTPFDWLVDETEKWCKDRAIYIAVMDSIEVIDQKSQRSTGEIPELLKDALSVSFDQHIGHDVLEDAEERWEFYNTEEEKLPFDLEYFNKITKGGLPNKTLNICLAGTGVGKSLFMCHMAASALMMNKSVLYITLEMSEERIAERIDANIMNVPMQDLPEMSKKEYGKKIGRLKSKTQGRLIVKEYPTASAHAGHFRHLLQELEIKKDFKPDIIFIDYLNICASQRIRPGAGANSYTLVKSIAEELRGVAVEYDVPIMSATQTTRSGFGSTDVGLEDTSESFGLPATADLMFALITSEELEELDQLVVKQLKNRYNDPTIFKRFVIGVDRARMKLYDVEQEAQEELVDGEMLIDDSIPVADRARPSTKFNDFNI
jgi:replicative DNA helicase|tara:strand:- start:3066 stop:4454 length:1389 start_codon:yes stop_codon:yes gene_type:complete